jgi:hypothetical protein
MVCAKRWTMVSLWAVTVTLCGWELIAPRSIPACVSMELARLLSSAACATLAGLDRFAIYVWTRARLATTKVSAFQTLVTAHQPPATPHSPLCEDATATLAGLDCSAKSVMAATVTSMATVMTTVPVLAHLPIWARRATSAVQAIAISEGTVKFHRTEAAVLLVSVASAGLVADVNSVMSILKELTAIAVSWATTWTRPTAAVSSV